MLMRQAKLTLPENVNRFLVELWAYRVCFRSIPDNPDVGIKRAIALHRL